MAAAALRYGDTVVFGEIDTDEESERATEILTPARVGVPAVAYYRNGVLMAVLAGANQDVEARVGRLLDGKAIGYNDGTRDKWVENETTPSSSPPPVEKKTWWLNWWRSK
jgi:hypothetical protein